MCRPRSWCAEIIHPDGRTVHACSTPKMVEPPVVVKGARLGASSQFITAPARTRCIPKRQVSVVRVPRVPRLFVSAHSVATVPQKQNVRIFHWPPARRRRGRLGRGTVHALDPSAGRRVHAVGPGGGAMALGYKGEGQTHAGASNTFFSPPLSFPCGPVSKASFLPSVQAASLSLLFLLQQVHS